MDHRLNEKIKEALFLPKLLCLSFIASGIVFMVFALLGFSPMEPMIDDARVLQAILVFVALFIAVLQIVRRRFVRYLLESSERSAEHRSTRHRSTEELRNLYFLATLLPLVLGEAPICIAFAGGFPAMELAAIAILSSVNAALCLPSDGVLESLLTKSYLNESDTQ